MLEFEIDTLIRDLQDMQVIARGNQAIDYNFEFDISLQRMIRAGYSASGPRDGAVRKL